MSLSRRRFLPSLLVLVVGCSGPPDGGSGGGSESPDTMSPAGTPTTSLGSVTTDAPTRVTATSSPMPQAEATSETAEEELDLREANVVGVEFEPSNGSYRFSVTLYHDDDGESGYADWWQVETLDGEQLGRRTLLHAHSTAPFTRSETISIPEGVRYVVVRGHDQTHGYGGQAMVVDLETGATEAVRQGPEPQDFSAYTPRS
ncbi:hypothetical protein C2R22_12635 [Salinigranum rubrum]|uniref:Lipoprotein n=1 Tax=Salinigranum rubrum TaxID=755307 RepID=A0A2I8VKG1_9EURY|nr:hypothetical protein [Salinigranum rubrum]AUV82384.1 hypothetical protein C2R22_12635 [Salinigranum rubrum]